MLKEVSAIDGVVEVEPFAVALLAGQVVDGVDSALSANTVRPSDRNHADQGNMYAGLSQLHGGGEARETSPYDDDVLLGHYPVKSKYLKPASAPRPTNASTNPNAVQIYPATRWL